MKRLIPLAFTVLLLLSACGKPAPPRDLAKMFVKVKVGMTKEEVIAAIGRPDDDNESELKAGGKAPPGLFMIFYPDLPRILEIDFREGKVISIKNIGFPVGSVPSL